ncbi:MAG: histidinol-phosphate transaminase [Actinobacteria bacterium]|nr:histidinol-phosphate transaminase [Actinomycetota bacterium]
MGYFRENIERMVGYVPGEQPVDPNVVKLNTNENPYLPSPAVLAALRNIDPERLRRYPDPTAGMFRQAAADVFDVSPDEIICGNGSDELLTIATRAFAGPQGVLAYPVPTYSLYRTLAHIEDAAFVEIPFEPDWTLPRKLFQTQASLVLLCNPNAPSGTIVPVAEASRLAGKIKGLLIIDEAYVDFADGNCLSLVHKHKNVLVLRTLSKGYSLAGLRFGFAVGNRKLIAGLNKVKDSYNCDALSILLATEAIMDQQTIAENARKVCAERDRLTQRLRSRGFSIPDSQANFLLARVPSDCALTAKQLYEQLKERSVYVRYFDQAPISGCIRITVGTPQQNDILLETMQQVGIEV